MRNRAALLLVAIVSLVIFKALVAAIEPRFVFFPYPGESRTPAALAIEYDVVRLETRDGEKLVAWQLEPDDPIADVLYFHGNGGNLSGWLPVFAMLHAFKLRVLAVDYRGYGLSSGRPTEAGVYLDAEAIARHAAQSRGVRSRPLVFWGRSLGGPIAASATRVVQPDGLILENSFSDKAAVIRSQPVLRMLNVFASYRFETARMLADFRNPVLVMHGDRDSIVPFAAGRDLFEQLRPPKQFVAVAGADHNDLIDASRSDYWTPVVEFIRRLEPR